MREASERASHRTFLDSGAMRDTPAATPRHDPTCCISDLGGIVHVSHGCGRSFLAHFGCGANVQVSVALQGGDVLVEKCSVALHSALDPQRMTALLQRLHRCKLPLHTFSACWLVICPVQCMRISCVIFVRSAGLQEA